ncbi:hypothetical protein CP995_25660 [Klebsiella pneumoniae]|nr:hypothetical protein CP995_25660 [Klebsiella pneumoniae]
MVIGSDWISNRSRMTSGIDVLFNCLLTTVPVPELKVSPTKSPKEVNELFISLKKLKKDYKRRFCPRR